MEKYSMLLVIIYSLLINSVFGQEEFGQIQRLIEREGLEVNFIFYGEGNGISDNGIVLFLKNKNDYRVDYSFEIIFKSDTSEAREPVSGRLSAHEMITGSIKNLYFIPFEDKRPIKEVGITKIRVIPASNDQ